MSLTRWVYRLTLWSLAFAPTITTSACVTKGTYDKKVAELETIRADHDHAAADRETELKALIDRLQTQVNEDDEQIKALTAELVELRKRIDETTTLAGADW
jgi:peptidoglycan hydrolase CwlO-like protein